MLQRSHSLDIQFTTLVIPFSPGETLQQLIRMVKLLGLKVGIILHATHAGKDLGMLWSQWCDNNQIWKNVLLDINFPKWTPTFMPCDLCPLWRAGCLNTARAQHWDPISGAFLLWFHWPSRKIAPKLVSKTCFAARQDFETMAQAFMLSFRMPHYAFCPCFVTFCVFLLILVLAFVPLDWSDLDWLGKFRVSASEQHTALDSAPKGLRSHWCPQTCITRCDLALLELDFRCHMW